MRLGVLISGHVSLVASYAACSILRVLTQWGATLVIIYERAHQANEVRTRFNSAPASTTPLRLHRRSDFTNGGTGHTPSGATRT